MDTALSDRVLFDRLAGVYARVMPPADGEKIRAGLSLAERDLDDGVDLGGGHGRGARAIPEMDWTVLDRAAGMLRQARRGGLAAVRGDATHLPLATDAVDAVLVVDALHHMPDHATLLGEVARVLRPGGVVVVRDFDPESAVGRAVVLGERLARFGSTFHTPRELSRLLERAGLAPRVVDRSLAYTVAGVA